MRYVMRIAEHSESSNLWTHIALLGIPGSMPVSVSVTPLTILFCCFVSQEAASKISMICGWWMSQLLQQQLCHLKLGNMQSSHFLCCLRNKRDQCRKWNKWTYFVWNLALHGVVVFFVNRKATCPQVKQVCFRWSSKTFACLLQTHPLLLGRMYYMLFG